MSQSILGSALIKECQQALKIQAMSKVFVNGIQVGDTVTFSSSVMSGVWTFTGESFIPQTRWKGRDGAPAVDYGIKPDILRGRP